MTLKENLKNVPLQTRLQIIEEIRKQRGLDYLITPPFRDTIDCFFPYSATKKGHAYWQKRAAKINAYLNRP